MAVTTNYLWTKPTVAGDVDAWGGELNTDLDSIDSTVFTVSGVANAALPKAGGTLTGAVNVLTATMKHTSLGTTNAPALNLALSNSFSFTVTAAWTPAVSNVPATANVIVPLLLKITNGGAFAPSWPAAFHFPGGTLPALTASGNDILALVSYDAGTTFRFLGISANV